MRKPNNIDIHVAKKIKLKRLELGFTQREFSELLGVSFQQFQKYENGTDRISCGKIYLIAKKLKVSTAFFFSNINDKSLSDFKDIDHKEFDLNNNIFIITLINHFSQRINSIKNQKAKKLLSNSVKNLVEFIKITKK